MSRDEHLSDLIVCMYVCMYFNQSLWIRLGLGGATYIQAKTGPIPKYWAQTKEQSTSYDG